LAISTQGKQFPSIRYKSEKPAATAASSSTVGGFAGPAAAGCRFMALRGNTSLPASPAAEFTITGFR